MKKKQVTESVYLTDHEAQTAAFNEQNKALATLMENFKAVRGFYPYRPSQSEYEALGMVEKKSADFFWNHSFVCQVVKRVQQADALADLWFRVYADTHH